MATIEAHGLAADPPPGWDGQIYRRDPLPAEALAVAPGADPIDAPSETTQPIVHLANFALPATRADFGSGAVEAMESGAVFIAVIEYEPEMAGTALYDHPVPWPLQPDDFSPEQLQRSYAGQAACQRFFTAQGRAFCLYAVIGSYRARAVLTRVVNDALAGVRIA